MTMAKKAMDEHSADRDDNQFARKLVTVFLDIVQENYTDQMFLKVQEEMRFFFVSPIGITIISDTGCGTYHVLDDRVCMKLKNSWAAKVPTEE